MSTSREADKLQALRAIGDSPADEYILTIPPSPRASSEPLEGIISQLRSLTVSDHPWVRAWVDQDDPLPTWADDEAIAAGRKFFANWDLDIMTALFCASLPTAYAAKAGVEVLEQVSQLATCWAAARRIAETGRMILAINQQEGLVPGSPGYRQIREVRLLHAAIRAELIKQKWDFARLGCPVNQEDMLGTLLCFTTVVFQALKRLGVPVTTDDQAGYLHLWAVVGHLLGVQKASIIRDPIEAESITESLAACLQGESLAGHHLMAVLLREMELSMPLGTRRLPRALVRRAAGDHVADLLCVPASPWWAPALLGTSAVSRLVGTIPGGRTVLQAPSRLVGRSLIRAWIELAIQGQQDPPFLPDEATLARWHIHISPQPGGLTLWGRLRLAQRCVRVCLHLAASAERRLDQR
jgi:ER-bound oxygenase mpaB/B'/Rubber oxygenase, catalytic domain